MVPTNELEELHRAPQSRRVLVWAMALVLLGIALYFGLQTREQTNVPAFSLPLLSNDGELTSSQLRGQPVVLNFFASWCIPCREEAPLLEEMWQRYRDDGVRFVGVNVQDTRANARLFVEEFGITYPVVTDYDQDLAKDLNLFGLPQTFFITRDWRFSSVQRGEALNETSGTQVLGAISERELRREIERLLRG